MKRLIRKAIWSWQDWRARRRMPDSLKKKRVLLFKARKNHGRTKFIERAMNNEILELMRSGK